MMFRTHIAVGFLIGLFLLQILNPVNQILFIFLMLLGAALPDIDHPESKIGSKIKVVGFLFEHRGFFHSLFAVLLLYLLLLHYIDSASVGVYIFAITAGYLSHVVTDSITKEGIMPFHPISKFRVSGFIKTGRITEYVFLVIILAVSLWKLFSVY
ncbi:MAG TPA: metal-dependent hydrolase [Candidatus Nanoarchaeia archaeon]|nr:metal-dependent hydrolase [Candidatus Nanoarchaeia archaeon]